MALLGMGVMGGRDCLRTEPKRQAAIKKLIESGSKGRSLSARSPYSLATVGSHIAARKAKIPPGMLEGMSDEAIFELVETAKGLNDAIKAYKRTHRTRTPRKRRKLTAADFLAIARGERQKKPRRKRNYPVADFLTAPAIEQPPDNPESAAADFLSSIRSTGKRLKNLRSRLPITDSEGDGLIYPALY